MHVEIMYKFSTVFHMAHLASTLRFLHALGHLESQYLLLLHS